MSTSLAAFPQTLQAPVSLVSKRMRTREDTHVAAAVWPWETNQGCLRAWSVLKRFVGFFSIMFPMKSLAVEVWYQHNKSTNEQIKSTGTKWICGLVVLGHLSNGLSIGFSPNCNVHVTLKILRLLIILAPSDLLTHEGENEGKHINTWVRDVVPEGWMEGVLGSHDLWEQQGLVIFKEGRIATKSGTKGQQTLLFISMKPFGCHGTVKQNYDTGLLCWLPDSQDVGDNSDGPTVHCLAVGFLGQNLRGCDGTSVGGCHGNKATRSEWDFKWPEWQLTHVSWCPAGRGHHAVFHRFGQAEVADHDFSVFFRAVKQQVLRLLGANTGRRSETRKKRQ